jgi:hypothetical protein
VKTITGNLLDITSGTILHQVNCRGVVGGLAGALHHKHPAAFNDYFLLCEKYSARNLGSVHEGHVSRSLSILHLFGQADPGPNTSMTAVNIALEGLIVRPLLQPVYAPHGMGCGLGGGDWPTYCAALLRVFPSLCIVQLPE